MTVCWGQGHRLVAIDRVRSRLHVIVPRHRLRLSSAPRRRPFRPGYGVHIDEPAAHASLRRCIHRERTSPSKIRRGPNRDTRNAGSPLRSSSSPHHCVTWLQAERRHKALRNLLMCDDLGILCRGRCHFHSLDRINLVRDRNKIHVERWLAFGRLHACSSDYPAERLTF